MKKALLISLSLGVALCFGFVQQKDCCAGGAKAAKTKMDCAGMSKSSCDKALSAEQQFMAEAKKMEMQAAKLGKSQDECCKSTAEKPMAKGDPGCCNAKGEPAMFKVYVAGVGYKYFGCEDSAAKARKELLAKHSKVGQVQKVTSKVAIS